MWTFVGVLAIMLVVALIDNVKLRLRLRQYEYVWSQIEAIGDKNEDGSFTLRVSHVEDHQSTQQHTCQTGAVVRLTSKQAA